MRRLFSFLLPVMIGIVCLVQTPTASAAYEKAYAAKGHTRGTVITIHGGGWYYVGEGAAQQMVQRAQWLSSQGFRVINISYQAGPGGYNDVKNVVRKYKAKNTCVYGESAGGTWALNVAHSLGVRCVIALAPVTDLVNLQADGATELAGVVGSLFVGANLYDYSPALKFSWPTTTRFFLAGVQCDLFHLAGQQERMAHVLENAGRSVKYKSWPCTASTSKQFLVHGYISAANLRIERANELAFLKRSLTNQ